jgi:hypothetical protein
MPITFWTEPTGASRSTIHVMFHDADGSPLTPTFASFRLDDTKRGEPVLDWQPLDVIGPSLSITIRHALTAMRSADRLTVTAHYANGATDAAAFDFSGRT